jgi:hypothetical protein
MTVKLSASAPDGFVVNSFAGDDAIACRDYVRDKLGMPAWQPNGNGNGHHISAEKEMAQAIAGLRKAKRAAPGSEPPRVVATYSYVDADGTLLYEVLRYEPKNFRQRRPLGGGGGYTWSLGDVKPVLYRCRSCSSFRMRPCSSPRARTTPIVSPRSS